MSTDRTDSEAVDVSMSNSDGIASRRQRRKVDPGKNLGVASLILAFVFAPLGLAFAIVSRGRSRDAGFHPSGLATAGLTVSILSVLGGIGLLAIVAIFGDDSTESVQASPVTQAAAFPVTGQDSGSTAVATPEPTSERTSSLPASTATTQTTALADTGWDRPVTDEPAAIPDANMEAAIAQATFPTERDMALIVRDPDAHKGEVIKLWAQIMQFDTRTGNDAFLAYVAGTPQQSWALDGNLAIMVGEASDFSSFVENDVLSATVIVGPSYTYQTPIGGENTVPTFMVLEISLTSEDVKAESPISIALDNVLPEEFVRYYSSDRIWNAVRLTSVRIETEEERYSPGNYEISLFLTGEKTYDDNGPYYSASVSVGVKIYDSEGYVVADADCYTDSLKVGEQFRDKECRVYAELPTGTYRVQLLPSD